jgi:hypothetical protein
MLPDTISASQILRSLKAAGHVTFEGSSSYDLNIFGIRSSDNTPNVFNDIVGCAYRDENLDWHCEHWQATTDPGAYHLQNPSRLAGTAILVPGQYRGVYKLDLHSGKYLALCQRAGKVRVWRDGNRNAQLDPDKSQVYTDARGINIHHASYTGTSTQVNKWSAGCQVIANIDDFNRLIALAKLQLQAHPTWSAFSYSLIDEADLLP